MSTVIKRDAEPLASMLWRRLAGPPAAGARGRTLAAQCAIFAVVASAVGFLVPGLATPGLLAVLVATACYALLAVGSNVVLGWSGMVTFFQGTFFGCGAYAAALLRNFTWPAELTLLAAIAATAVIGFVAFLGLSRYTHIAFAMLTLVFGQLLLLIATNNKALGATDGFYGILRQPIFGAGVELDTQFWWLAFGSLVLGMIVYWWLNRRVLALRMYAGREDAARLETLGYNVRLLQATAGAISAAFCATGGALFAQYSGAVSPTLLQFDLSGAALFMCVIGGMRYLWGPIVGAVLYTLTVDYWLESSLSTTLYTGIAFVVVMLVVPGGILSVMSRLGALRDRRRLLSQREHRQRGSGVAR